MDAIIAGEPRFLVPGHDSRRVRALPRVQIRIVRIE